MSCDRWDPSFMRDLPGYDGRGASKALARVRRRVAAYKLGRNLRGLLVAEMAPEQEAREAMTAAEPWRRHAVRESEDV